MYYFANGEGTQWVEANFIDIDDSDNLLPPSMEHLRHLKNTNPFIDKLKERAIAHGFSGSLDNNALREFVCQRLSEELGIADGKAKKNLNDRIRNWFNPNEAVMPKREIVYQLCFALGMDAMETAEFFIKGFLERPYNFKELKETVYFYCLNNGLHYKDSEALYQKAYALRNEDATSAESATMTIGSTILSFHDEEVFLEYVQQNRQSFETKSTSANREISRLKEECAVLAQQEHKARYSSDYQDAIAERDDRVEKDARNDPNQKDADFSLPQKKDIQINTLESLLSAIYGRSSRNMTANITSEEKEQIPKLVHDALITNHMQSNQIDKGTATDSLKRSTLIILTFYHFFVGRQLRNLENSIDVYDEFVDKMNETLLRCGYGMLYWRNPFDWLFGFCASKSTPLDAFREIIQDIYPNPEE